MMDNSASKIFPALIVNQCPIGCDGPCARLWINGAIGHSIICKCSCGHDKKQTALERVGGSATNAVQLSQSSRRWSKDD